MTTGDFLFSFLKAPFKWFFKFTLNVEEKINEAKNYKGPFLMIGAHPAEEDSLMSIAYSKKLIRFLAADANWDVGWKSVAFKIFNVIPFARKRLDIKAIRKLKRTIEDGYSIGLFPEGARTWDGQTLPIIPSIAKLVKLLNIPVFNISFNGLHLSRPRWAERNGRRGKVEVSIKQVLSKEKVKTVSKQEVLETIEKSIDYNEFDWQRKAMVEFKGKNYAEYVERFLYRCPDCLALNSLHSKGDDFSCEECGAKYSINKYGFIEGCKKFDNTVDWNAWQKPTLDEVIKKGFSFEQKDMQLERVYENELKVDRIDMVFDTEGLDISFPDGSKEYIPIRKAESCNAIYGDRIEIYVDGIKHRFLFEPLKNHMSVKLFEELLKGRYEIKKIDA